MQHITLALSAALLIGGACRAQTLIDSIPYPGISQGFWGIHVENDTIFLGADISGNVYYSDHAGNLFGQQATGYDFNHGLIRRTNSYLIAEDYTTAGAGLYEVDFNGNLLNSWTFPAVIGGNSSGIGDICADGDAIWYTMYYPDFDEFPYAYAYRWQPGAAAPTDTVPMHGEQPYGITLKGDTLLYVTDDLNGDAERIYAYNLTTRQDIGYVDLPDPDGDQSPRGMYYDGTYLYLVAQRMGGSAFAYQTVYIFDFDATVGIGESALPTVSVHPSPAHDQAVVELPFNLQSGASRLEVFNAAGTRVFEAQVAGSRYVLNTAPWPEGLYLVRASTGTGKAAVARLVVAH